MSMPPPPAAPPPPPPPAGTNLGMAPNVAGLLCYAPCCIGLVFSLVAAIVEKQSRFLRFHAFQSLLLHGAFVVIAIVVQIGIMVIGFVSGALAFLASLLWLLVAVAMLGLQILLMVKAYNHEEYALPVIGEMAQRWV
jgi:uncharacterized membrane protein